MDQAEITKLTRRGIREEQPLHYEDKEIAIMTIHAVRFLGMLIKSHDPSFYNERTSLTSYTHIFTKPSDALTLLRVWDMDTNAGDITGATNASPISITLADHGFGDDAIVHIHGVLGNTAANGTWLITLVDDDTFTLDGSTGNAAYTSGGKAYETVENPRKIEKINLREATLRDETAWYPRGNYIVVDDKDFTNDIILDYIRMPTAITDIPEEYHMGLVAYNVLHMIRMPPQEAMNFTDMVSSQQLHKEFLGITEAQIAETFSVSDEPEDIAMGIDFEDYV
jgi:hypothetical protein